MKRADYDQRLQDQLARQTDLGIIDDSSLHKSTYMPAYKVSMQAPATSPDSAKEKPAPAITAKI